MTTIRLAEDANAAFRDESRRARELTRETSVCEIRAKLGTVQITLTMLAVRKVDQLRRE